MAQLNFGGVTETVVIRDSFEYGGIQIFRIYFQYIYQIFPCPADSFFLEVISERPVAQHFEHSMVAVSYTHLDVYKRQSLRLANS